MIDQQLTPTEQPEVDGPEGSNPTSPPQLLPMRAEPAIRTAATASSTPNIPLLVGLLSVAVFGVLPVLATMALGRLWREKVNRDW